MRSNHSGGVTSRAKQALSVAAVAGAAGLSLAPGIATAADEAVSTASWDAATEVSAIDVNGRRQEKPSSTKITTDPVDTPQTITVVSERTIRDQNLLTLRDVLTTVPGITFGAGEGGGGYGDSINLRGYVANNDITSDGLRDSAQYTRSDPFNLAQIEVINGANSVYAGAGSLGGSINLVSKAPMAGDRTTLTAGIGTDAYGRFTLDANRQLADGVAARLNLMIHGNDSPGRDVETYDRWGVAPSVTFGLGGPTQVTLSWFHQEDENIPEYGVPYASNAFLNGPLPGVDPSSYYGYRNLDTQESEVDTGTAKLVHEFSDDLTVTSVLRYQRVTQLTIVDPPQGTWCLASGFNAQTGAACGTPGVYQPSGPRGNLRDTGNELWVSQTDVNWKFATGSIAHNMVVGVAISHEEYDLVTGRILRNPGGALPDPVLPPMDIAHPDNVWTGPVNFVLTSHNTGELDNRAIYIFDTAELNERWMISGGLRVESVEGTFHTGSTGFTGKTDETLVSYRLGLVYKPLPDASVYLVYGNTESPSQATVNGGCTAANCDVDPEEGEVVELGAKWDAFGGRVSLTAALFQNERSKYRVNSLDPTVPEQQLDGASRVRGAALGVSGQLSERWTVIANYTWLDSEILGSIADNSPTPTIDPQKGDPIALTPEHAFNIWTSYQVTETLLVGYGATYSGEYAFNRPTGSARLFYAPDYWVQNAAVTWSPTDALSLQLNIKNLTDEGYYTRVRSNNGFGWATPGDARSAQVTLTYRF